MRKHWFGRLGFAVGVSMALAANPAAASTLTVPSEYETIALAVEASVEGDVIEVSPGSYSGHVIVSTAITIRGLPTEEEAVELLGNEELETVLDLRPESGKRITVDGLTIRSGGAKRCIRVSGHPDGDVLVRNCHLEGRATYEMICVLAERGNVIVEDSSFDGPNKAAWLLDRSVGVGVFAGCSGTARRCSFAHFEDGAETWGGDSLVVDECSFRKCIGGTVIWNSEFDRTAVRVTRNVFDDCTVGIVLAGRVSVAEVSYNKITDSRWMAFRIEVPSLCDRTDAAPFSGELTGRHNDVDDLDSQCPSEDDSFWPCRFFL